MPYPFNTIKVDRAKLVDLLNRTVNKKKYKLGAKAALDSQPEAWAQIDCSGFVRYLLHKMAGGLTIPDGSWNQHSWCTSKNFKPTVYEDVAGLSDDRLRIAFINPVGKKAGHVWLILNAKTIESCGGKGPTRRKWDSKPLLSSVCACYVLTGPLS